MIIGKLYEVAAIEVRNWYGLDGFIPIVGPEHQDVEFINFPWDHWHIDWRFASQKIVRHFDYRPLNHLYAYVVMRVGTNGIPIAFGEPVIKRMTCKREWPEYPWQQANWLPDLTRQFRCAKIVNGVCPHRGIPVSAMHREGDVLTCPGHGLQWNAVTGLLHTSTGDQK